MSDEKKPGAPGEYIELGWEDIATFHAVWGHVSREQAWQTIRKSDEWKYSEPKHDDYSDPVHAWGGWFPSDDEQWDRVFRVHREPFDGGHPVTVMWLEGREWAYGACKVVVPGE